jgi:Uma2 family endonuclease
MNSCITSARLEAWNEANDLGVAFDSSTGFVLPYRVMRAPDAAWVAKERWQALTAEEQEQFPPLCPDFVVELRSSGDKLKKLQKRCGSGCKTVAAWPG